MGKKGILIFILILWVFSIKTETHYYDLSEFITDFSFCDYNPSIDLKDLEWQPIKIFEDTKLPNRTDLFFKIKLPENNFEYPVIFLYYYLDGVAIYLEKEPFFLYGSIPGNEVSDFEYCGEHTVALPKDHFGKEIIIQFHNDVHIYFGNLETFLLCDKEHIPKIEKKIWLNQMKKISLSFLLAFTGILCIFIFFMEYKKKLYAFLFFGMFCLSAAIDHILLMNLSKILNWSTFKVEFIDLLNTFVLPVFLLIFYTFMFFPEKIKLLKILIFSHILLFLTILLLLLFSIYSGLITLLLILLLLELIDILILVFIFFSTKIHKYYLKPIPIIGLLALSILSILEVTSFLEILPNYDYFYGYGIIIFAFSLSYILIKHYQVTQKRVFDYTLELEKNKTQLLELHKINLKSQLSALKDQINPHFLFNSFSTLISVIEEKPRIAVEFVEEMSSVYRYLLQNQDKDLITLDEELNFLGSYCFLLSKRFGDSFNLKIDTPDSYLILKIPTFSLQLLIENAVKHNVISRRRPLFIKVYVENDYLVIRNNLQKKKIFKHHSGKGLKNIKRRYKFFTHQNIIIENLNSYFKVKIPLLKEEI